MQDFLFPLTVPRILFTDRVLVFLVMLRRRGTHSGTVQKTDEFPQMQFPQLLGWGPCGESAGAVLGQV